MKPLTKKWVRTLAGFGWFGERFNFFDSTLFIENEWFLQNSVWKFTSSVVHFSGQICFPRMNWKIVGITHRSASHWMHCFQDPSIQINGTAQQTSQTQLVYYSLWIEVSRPYSRMGKFSLFIIFVALCNRRFSKFNELF